ncbi:MAG: HAMP domain-containing histidine kinase [Bacteroidales bacterium]|nr:HAMP domain-containing histidine kinase [Bacteroidales bacterium]
MLIPVLNFTTTRKTPYIYSNLINQSHKYNLYETDLLSLDLPHSMQVKAYIQTPFYIIFQKMAFQLIISYVLIVAAIYCLLKLSGSILGQWKEQEIKQGFINTMTHELKRPITSSLAMLEYVGDGIKENDYSSAEEFISDSVFALKKLNSYIEKIQEISKGEQGKIEFEWNTIELHSFFEKLTQKYPSRADKKIRFVTEIPENLLFHTDILHFSNMMDNLVENSIKYSKEEVTINIKVSVINGFIEIRHKDNGLGISDSEINRIFDKFFRSNSAEKRRKSGFGLGLSYVLLIVQNMKGSIKVESKEKEFTEFILELPNKTPVNKE